MNSRPKQNDLIKVERSRCPNSLHCSKLAFVEQGGTLRWLQGFRCRPSSGREEMGHVGRHQQPHQKLTYTNKQSGSKLEGGGRRKWRRRRRVRYCTEVECFHVLMPHKRELFPPTVQYMGWYCPWHGPGCKTDFRWTFPWWTVCAVPASDSLQQLRHGLGLYRDGWQQLVLRSLKYGSADIWSFYWTFIKYLLASALHL